MEPVAVVRRRAIEWCRNLAGWFPNLRPGADALAVAEDVAASLGPNDGHLPACHVRAVLARMSESERRRLVDSFVREHGDQWAAVRADSGGGEALDEALAAGAARAAIIERRLPHASRLSDLETGRAPARSPRDVLAVTLLPETVWSVVEATNAEHLVRTGSPRAWLDAVMAAASEHASEVHARRIKTLAAALARQLPLVELPRASSLLAEGYERVADEPGFTGLVAEWLLPLYLVQRASYTTSSRASLGGRSTPRAGR